MKVLLDNNIRRFASGLSEHEFIHVQELGWQGLQNGNLLSRAEEAGFDVLVTADKQMKFQQNLAGRGLSVVVLNVRSLTLSELLPLRVPLLNVLPSLTPGQFRTLS